MVGTWEAHRSLRFRGPLPDPQTQFAAGAAADWWPPSPDFLRFVLIATVSSTAGAALVALVALQPALAVLKDR